MLPRLALIQLFFLHRVCVYALIPPRQLLDFIPEDDTPPLIPTTTTTKEQRPSLTIEIHTTPLIVSLLSSISEKALETHRTETHTQSTTTSPSISSSIISESSTSMLASTASIPTSSTSSSTKSYSTVPPKTHIGTPTHHDDIHPKPSPSPPPQEESKMSRGKVVGITALCILIAVVITMMLGFFDTWWGFIKGVVTGKRKGDDSDLSEDWEKKRTISWLGGDENLYSGAEKGGGGGAMPAVPSPTYAAAWDDPHPFDPLFRRPSTRPMPPFRPQPY